MVSQLLHTLFKLGRHYWVSINNRTVPEELFFFRFTSVSPDAFELFWTTGL